MIEIVLATANAHKASEIGRILAPTRRRGLILLERPSGVPEVVEDGETLEDNARLKATALYEATGRPALADDTGLFVEALDGAPGVRSARFAGEEASYADNVEKLLGLLASRRERRARFSTVAHLYLGPETELRALGSVDGTIAFSARGEGGFGYDPVFVPDGSDGRTYAEMGPDEKDTVSHRGRALRALAGQLVAEGLLG